MDPRRALDALTAHLRHTGALAQVTELLHWDQETCMPPTGGELRGAQCAAMEATLHDRRTDPRIGDWLAAIGDAPLSAADAVNVAEAGRRLERASKRPARLALELARITSTAHGVWTEARKQERFAAFAPTLERIVELKREEASALATGDGPWALYDALLEDFEPGARAADIDAMLRGLRARLVGLIDPDARPMPDLRGTVDRDAQLAVARTVATAMGYDWTAGRLDLAVHPFSSGAGGDVRITTRVDPDNFLDCLYSTVHEVGHALYEQGIPRELGLTPAGEAASMGVHESQSRLWENQIGRSRPFLRWLYPQLVTVFGEDLGARDADELYAAINHVRPSFVRTEADEVTYNLHVALRFDLEQALLTGDLAVRDLEAAWNDRMQADLGVTVPTATLGVLQDVHWSAGLFGYFPTYSLGNVYAAELYAAMRRHVPDLDARLEAGDTSGVLSWLRQHVHRHGKLLPARDLIARAVGHPPTEAPLVAYLEAKVGELSA